MNGTVNARVRRVVIGHSERALIHAVDGDNLEFKIEVPSEAVRGLVPGQELMLTLSWKLEPLVDTTSRATAAPLARAPTSLPSAVDEEFMALMARRRGAPAAAGTPQSGPVTPTTTSTSGPTSGSESTAAEQLAQRLGIRRRAG
jgi:hypothetical protein